MGEEVFQIEVLLQHWDEVLKKEEYLHQIPHHVKYTPGL
jgi:hypothetical protein